MFTPGAVITMSLMPFIPSFKLSIDFCEWLPLSKVDQSCGSGWKDRHYVVSSSNWGKGSQKPVMCVILKPVKLFREKERRCSFEEQHDHPQPSCDSHVYDRKRPDR